MPIAIYATTLTLKNAESFVLSQPQNRPVNRRTVLQYADDIVNGRWGVTAKTIELNEQGLMIDGQHRCLALIEANKRQPEITSIPVIVMTGVPDSAQDHIDIGRQRTVADQLSLRGYAYSSIIGAAARHVLTYQATGGSEITRSMSHPLLLDWVEDHPSIIDHAQALGRHTLNTSGIPHSGMVAAYYLVADNGSDEQHIGEFMFNLRTGANLTENDPILTLRNRMLNAQQKNEQIGTAIRFVLVLRTWNSWRRGESITKLPIRSGSGNGGVGKLIQPGRLEK